MKTMLQKAPSIVVIFAYSFFLYPFVTQWGDLKAKWIATYPVEDASLSEMLFIVHGILSPGLLIALLALAALIFMGGRHSLYVGIICIVIFPIHVIASYALSANFGIWAALQLVVLAIIALTWVYVPKLAR